MTSKAAGLSVRPRLALAVLLIFAVPALTLAVVGIFAYHNTMSSTPNAAALVRSGAKQWNTPGWRARTSKALAASGYGFTLTRGTKILYAGRTSIFTGGHPAGPPRQQVQVQRVSASGAPSGEVAYVYGGGSPWSGSGMLWIVPLAGIVALLITLATLSWYFGRTLVRPLTAAGMAARQIAAGDLDVHIPPSKIREVAELRSAFSVMSSELRASVIQQAKLEEERRMFIGAIAHDLRTPLFSLRGYLEGLEEGLAATPEKRSEYVRVCREKADALERLVGDLFAYARVEYLEESLRREPVDVGELVSDIVQTHCSGGSSIWDRGGSGRTLATGGGSRRPPAAGASTREHGGQRAPLHASKRSHLRRRLLRQRQRHPQSCRLRTRNPAVRPGARI